MHEELTFSQVIKKYRKQHNLTQAQLAEMVGKAQSAVAGWESGRAHALGNELVILSRVTDIPLSLLSESIAYSKRLKDEKMQQVRVSLSSNESIQAIKDKYRIEIDGRELTDEELKRALEVIELERFKRSRN